MSESRAAQGADAAGPALPRPELVTDLFAGNGDHGDDAPTIISKAPPQPGRLEDAIGGTLRGRRLAHFELIEPIGVGGMAAVIRARDLQLDRSVALKILPPEMAGDEENVRRFHQEARAAARLDHENIARVFFCGEDQRLHFIAFEFVEGENLRVILERRGRLPVPEAIHYMLQVATGLAHASARGVVHRDIKPSNIIVTANGRAKLVDMGLARSQEPHSDNGLTQSGVTLGTFDYISPEQALEPRDADVRSDIYSLGCTFYHMLTGQPPVPEGTAARKLHHHHHVAPVDPRQLNPAIPDDVAAILARMMAKDPKDRYQRAEHLVQHLIQVAQKQGAINESPDGVLFVDAPLPSPPRKRPALMAALAVIALTALIAILSLAPTESMRGNRAANGSDSPAVTVRDGGDAKADKKNDKLPEETDEHVHSVKDLAAALAKKQVRRIVLEKDINVPEDSDVAGLVFRGDADRGPLTIESSPDAKKAYAIRVAYLTDSPRNHRWAALAFEGGSVTLSNLRFEVEGKAPTAGDAGLALLAFGRGKFLVQKCTFVQKYLTQPAVSKPDARLPVASVAVDGSATEEPVLTFKECYFETGQAAVALTGPATINAKDCAFGPHAALFHLRGRSRQTDTLLALTNCSAFVVDGPAFRLDRDAGCRLNVRYSVFSRPNGRLGTAGGPQPDLISQTNSPERNVCYVGQRNAYHNLNAYWVRSSPDKTERVKSDYGDFDKFQREVRSVQDGMDKQSEPLQRDDSPWKIKDPLRDETEPLQMFRLKVDKPELRTENRYENQMIGVLSFRGERMYESVPPLPDKISPVVVAKKKVKIVDPDPKAATGDGIYHTLAAAIDDAEPGDEIQIKTDGEVPIKPIFLDKAGVNLTIKPHAGFHPVLTLIEKTIQREAALFRLHDGQVVFEHLEFLFKPNKDFEFQTLVEMMGNGSCTFKQCLLTLLENDKVPTEKRASVVRLTDPGKAMKMTPEPTRAAPEIRFQNCLVRGQGDLVAVLPSRPLDLDVTNAVVALDGCLLAVNGTVKDPPDSATSNQVVRLTNVTTYLTESLLWLRAKSGGKGLIGTSVKRAVDCLFVGAGGKPFIQLDGLDSQGQMKRLIEWEEGKHNAYMKYEKMIDNTEHSSYDAELWQKSDNIKDQDPRFFAKAKKIEKPLSEVTPADFREMKSDDSRVDLQRYGPELDKLPQPTAPESRENDGDGETQIN
jgi:serine/threonine protein kinase